MIAGESSTCALELKWFDKQLMQSDCSNGNAWPTFHGLLKMKIKSVVCLRKGYWVKNKQTNRNPPQNSRHTKETKLPRRKKKSAVQFKPKYFIFMYLYLAEIVNHNLMVNKKIESFLPWFLLSLFHTLLVSQPNSRRVISYITQFRFVSCASGRKEGAPIWMFIGVKSAILFMKRYLSNLFLEDICLLVFKMRSSEFAMVFPELPQ